MAVEGMSKRYGDQVALANVCFSARRSEILGLIGPNGVYAANELFCVCHILQTRQVLDQERLRLCRPPFMTG